MAAEVGVGEVAGGRGGGQAERDLGRRRIGALGSGGGTQRVMRNWSEGAGQGEEREVTGLRRGGGGGRRIGC